MSYLSDALHVHSFKHRYPYNLGGQLTQSLLFLDPNLDMVPIGHSI